MQNKGIGSILLDEIESEIMKSNKFIAVLVFERNPFKGFYTKNNFVKISEQEIDMGDFTLAGNIYIKYQVNYNET